MSAAAEQTNTPNRAEIRSLGFFHPSLFEKEVIEAELKAHPQVPSCCRCERIGVRVPHERAPQPPPANLEWHQDGLPAYHVIVWATEDPTELQTSDGTYFRGQPFELIWFDNTKVFHRQPTGTNEQRRWFLAVRCSGEIF